MSNKTLSQVGLDEIPDEVRLQFNVNVDGDKDAKYSQAQIFEIKKATVKSIKKMSKAELKKRDAKVLARGKAKSSALNAKNLASGKYVKSKD